MDRTDRLNRVTTCYNQSPNTIIREPYKISWKELTTSWSKLFESDVYTEIHDTNESLWNRQFFQLDSSHSIITKPIDSYGRCDFPNDQPNTFINEITLCQVDDQFYQQGRVLFLCNDFKFADIPLSAFYLKDGKVSISQALFSYDKPFPSKSFYPWHDLTLRLQSKTEIYSAGLHYEFDVSYGHTIEKLLPMTFQWFSLVKNQVPSDSILKYQNYLPHTGFMIKYTDGQDHLDKLTLNYIFQVGGSICMGAGWGGSLMTLQIQDYQPKYSNQCYQCSYTNHESLFQHQWTSALNMTPLQCQLAFHHKISKPADIDCYVYHVYCNQLIVNQQIGLKYNL